MKSRSKREERKEGKEKGVKEWNGKEKWVIGGFILASGFILFFNLWGRSLENHDYLRYAEVAREMIRSGDWIVSHYNGEIYINKPPLLFWLIAIPSTLFGTVTPLTARLPSFFAAWVGVVVTCLWARKVYGTILSGLISGGALLSAYQYFIQARLAKTDTLLCVFILLSLYFFYLGHREPRRRRFFYHGLSFGFIGLGNLTKGPFGMVSLLIIALFLIKEGEVKRLIRKEFLAGYFILALTSLPWVFLFIHQVGWEQAITLIRENKILSRQAPVYFYFLEIWGQWLPWSLLLPLMGYYAWRERQRIWHSQASLFLIWFFLLFVLLTLIKVRASRYLLPLLPPLALILGGMWGGMWGGVWGERLKKKRNLLLIPFLLSLLVWHSIEIYRIRNDQAHSPGRILARELRPLVKDATLIGYRLELGAVEEINFYLERVIPTSKTISDLSIHLRGKEKRWVLMPKVAYDNIRLQSDLPMVFIQEFPYKDKKGRRLVLVSNGPEETSPIIK